MIAGPQFSNYMAQVAPAYGTNPFPAPPSNMLNGPGAARQSVDAGTSAGSTRPATGAGTAPATQRPRATRRRHRRTATGKQ